MEKNHVLLVDNDETTLTILYKVLKSNGLDADTASSGEEALEMLQKKDYQALFLEINLPGMDGFLLIEDLRKRNVPLPIVIISSRTDDYDQIYGLEVGADDYITKPFNPIVLGAKAKAVIRRYLMHKNQATHVITAGPFQYNTTTLRFYKNNEEILLSAKENAMMKLFIDNINRIFSKNMLYDLIWNESIIDENVIMVYVNRLRQKIEEDPSSPKYIQTVRGLGYRFVIS